MIENPQAHVVEGSNGLLLEIDGQIVPNYDATMQPFEEGEVVTGNVVRIDKDEVLVDIGYKSEGVIPANELSIRKSVDPREEVSLGEEVDAMVLTKEDQDGRLIMSKKRARFEKAWRRIEAAAESGEPVMGSVIEVVKGGLIIDLGVRGFLPASLVDIRRVPNLDEYMGTQIETKVIELNRSRNNVVLSRRAVLEEERKEVRQQILDRLQPGLVVEGQISNIVDFGAFVDLDGIDGLIHISELSWSHVNHPSEILNIGDTVQVKVLDIDRDRQRISLGLKQTQEDPWQRIVDTYNTGDELAGKVTKVVTFGAFVEVLDGVEGLVHISELAGHHVESPREIVHPGDGIRVKILEIDSERRRLSLSAKRVEDQILPLARPDGAGGEPIEPASAEEAAEYVGAPDAGDEYAGRQPASEVVEQQVAPDAEAASPEIASIEIAGDEAISESATLHVQEPVAPEATFAPQEAPTDESPAAEVAVDVPPVVDEPPAGDEPSPTEAAAEETETAADEPLSAEEPLAETEQSAASNLPTPDTQPAEQTQD
jgi:small subunit ribosomal protein S1